MSLTKLTDNLNIIQALPDKPTNTATELKQKFDEASNKIKTYTNETLTEELDSALSTINTTLSSKANSSEVYTKTETDTLLGTKANTSDVNTSLSGKAPNNHASSSTTYGVATSSNYGHCKVIQSTNISTINDGEALGAYQGYYLKSLINNGLNSKLSTSGGSIYGTLVTREIDVADNASIYLVNGEKTITLNGSTGNVTVGNNLYVDDGAIRSAHTYDYDTVSNSTNMYITSNGWIRRTTNTSSERYKTDIKDLEENLNPEKLYNLKIKQFKYKSEYQPSENDKRYNKNLIGFIAEDVERVYPIAVDYTEDGQVDNWNERYIIPAMLKLIQDQKKQIDNLEERISNMEV